MLPRKTSRSQLRLDAGSPTPRIGSPSPPSSSSSVGTRLLKKASRPRLRLDSPQAGAPPSSFVPVVPDGSPETVAYTHSSVFRSAHMEMYVASPSVKLVQQHAQEPPVSLPMFGEHDRVSGMLTLDPNACGPSGRVTITMEGVFTYVTPADGARGGPKQTHRHVFHTESITPTTPTSTESSGSGGSPRSATVSSLRGALGAIRKRSNSSTSRTSGSSNSSGGSTSPGAPPTYPFSFDIPTKNASGDEFPPTFYMSNVMEGGVRTRAVVEIAEVTYRLFALWEAEDGSDDHALLEAPILIQPDTDWSSLDGLSIEPEAWLEVPLKSERPLPFQCALTIASPASFPRSAAIPFYVVFTTTPRSPGLAAEIAADATVSVSLARTITLGSGPSPQPPSRPASRVASSLQRERMSSAPSSAVTPAPPSAFGGASTGRGTSPPPSTSYHPGSSSDDSDASFMDMPRPPPRLLGRSVRSAPPVLSRAPPPPPLFPRATAAGSAAPSPAPLPIPPRGGSTVGSDTTQQRTTGVGPRKRVFTETRTLQTDVCVGFPKRPRAPTPPGGGRRGHPPLEEQRLLPDGLYKGRLQLNRNMMPGIEWAGLRVKYYVDVSVLFGQDELRARVPVRVF